MRRLGSLVMRVADATRVPAGACLAVDRMHFADGVTQAVEALPAVRIGRGEMTRIPPALTLVPTGPLTPPALSQGPPPVLGTPHPFLYDAIAPIGTTASIDIGVAGEAS